MIRIPSGILFLMLAACASVEPTMPPQPKNPVPRPGLDLGAFSVSLAVKDLAASRAFYEKLGFRQAAGDAAQNWLILRNGDCNLGLFQGMFEKNILTFNPGWSHEAEPLKEFTDVRVIQQRLEQQGIELQTRCDVDTKGPASFMLVDPDGNPVLFDQHRD